MLVVKLSIILRNVLNAIFECSIKYSIKAVKDPSCALPTLKLSPRFC